MATQIHSSPKQDLERDAGQQLLRWRWLALAVVLAISVPLEILEDGGIDLKSTIEITIYLLLAWLLLTVMAHRMKALAQRRADSELRSQIIHDLTLHRQFDQLAYYIVNFPATILPVDHTSLFFYDHLQAKLQFVREWNIATRVNSPVPRYLKESDVCQACLHSRLPTSRHTSACASDLGIQLDAAASEYCLPLRYEQLLVGMLRMRCRADQHFTRDQLDFLQSLAPEITLALATSISYARQVDHTRVEAQNRERQRLTHELHDSLAQRAFYLQLGLDQLNSDPSLADEAVSAKIERLRRVAAEMYDEIRFNLDNLHNSIVPDILTGVRALADELTANDNLCIEVRAEGDAAELSAETIQVILGILQEGLNNVVRHAQATHVQITLRWAIDHLTIRLDDDGQGFDPKTVSQTGHYGLAFLHERASSLHGELIMSSAPGRGTCLQFSLPLQPPDPAQTYSRTDRSEAAPVSPLHIPLINVEANAVTY